MDKEKKSCLTCEHRKPIDGRKFKCLVNYQTYRRPDPCFCYKKKVTS